MNTSRHTSKIVIIGAGFGGINCAKALKNTNAEVIVIDRNNHHLFQPLLYQVATAGLSPADIASPIRKILCKQKNTTVIMAEVTGIDKVKRVVITQNKTIPYDYLVIATGSNHSYFDHSEWEKYAPGLKTIEDARSIRKKILLSFELAEMEDKKELQKALLTFVIVGGGPTGVEMAGAIAELSYKALASDFKRINPTNSKIILIEAAQRILTSYPEKLSELARKALEKLKVDVRTDTIVQNIDSNGVTTSKEYIKAKTVIWGAGNSASPAGKWLNTKIDKIGRIITTPELSLMEDHNIYVIGDTASVFQNNKPLPGIAPVATQQGKYVAGCIKEKLAGKKDLKPFKYKDRGQLATIGRSFAIADFKWLSISGLFAWLMWVFIHIYFLIGFRNRIVVLFEWAWSYFTFQKGARIISNKGD